MILSPDKKKYIERQVDALLADYGYSSETDAYVDIVNLAKKFGFSVGNAKLSDNEDGYIIIQPHKNLSVNSNFPSLSKVIGVNVNRQLELKRFIVAHEFAHSVLHYKGEGLFLHRDNIKGKNEDENAADYFAAAILMPKLSFTREYQKLLNQQLSTNTICYRLAALYKVPFESVYRRISEVTAEPTA